MSAEQSPEYKIIVRDAEEYDSQSVADLLEELGYPVARQFASEKIRKLSKQRRDRMLVAERDDKVVGVLSLHIMPLLHRPGKLCRVSALVVLKAHRGYYIGRRLMEMAEAYARSQGCERIEVTSGDQRTEAHEFYHRIGYTEVSRRFIKEI